MDYTELYIKHVYRGPTVKPTKYEEWFLRCVVLTFMSCKGSVRSPMNKGQIYIGLITRCVQNKVILITQIHGSVHNLFTKSQITWIPPFSPPAHY
jgi:hypothetical protein